jgi:putative heme-binding domain-containing protein
MLALSTSKSPWIRAFVFLIFLLVAPENLDRIRAQTPDWQKVDAPDVWKKPPPGKQGYGWYRCAIAIPKEWTGRDFELFVEPVDDSREFYLNGTRVGGAGSFPPEFRSGLGDATRHSVTPSIVRPGEWNVLAIRVFDSDGRGGFNVAAPVFFANDSAIRLQGTWQFRGGDNPEWSSQSETDTIPNEARFSSTISAAEANKILRQLPGEQGPLSPLDAVSKFSTAPGLEVRLVLSEPHIGQPLSMKFDERGRLWVVQYLQYPSPAGLKMLSRDKFLRSVYDKTPLPPPNHFRGLDKISIHEDSNGDGVYDRHKVFVDGLSLATSMEFDRDGIWVLNPPYLLFYPDKDHDDLPDQDPEVHLQGFGLEDSHSVTNNLRWGPDGWLYASQGSTVTGQVKLYGSQDKPVHSMGQLIWRYHPRMRRYEIFAEGGGNSFGVEFDAKGRLYSGHNGGDTRGFHYVQGGYYQKGFGKHGALSNPFAFGYFEMMKHHSVPRFTHCFVINEGGALGDAYEGKLFGVSPLLNHIIYSTKTPDGSTFSTADVGRALTTDDPWFRPVDIQAGPDGAIYVADMYEQRIDHASHYQGRIDRDSGRVYRLAMPQSPPTNTSALTQLFSQTPMDDSILGSNNKWVRQVSQRLLMQLTPNMDTKSLVQKLESLSGQPALECLWRINTLGQLSETVAFQAMQHSDPYVRLWAVRLRCDTKIVSPAFANALTLLAEKEPNVEVRSQLASSARRLDGAHCLAIVQALIRQDQDVEDPHIPLLLWWAIESKADSHRALIRHYCEQAEWWNNRIVEKHLAERLMRRYASAGTHQDLLTCAQLLAAAPTNTHVQSLMRGFEKAFEGRSLVGLPDELVQVMAKRNAGSLALRLRQSDPQALQEALVIIADGKAKKPERIQTIEVLGQMKLAGATQALLTLLQSSQDQDIQSAVISALQSFDSELVGQELLLQFDRLAPESKKVCLSVLVSRLNWANALLAQIEAGKLAPQAVPLEAVQRMSIYEDRAIAAKLDKYWPNVQGASPANMRIQIESVTRILDSGTGNPYQGKLLYKTQCGKCHVLFEEGGLVGPALTQYKRDDLVVMLANIVNPSLQIREGYETFQIVTSDGLTVSGFITDQDNRTVVLRTADGQTIVIPRDDIESMKASTTSIMPTGLLDNLDEQQVRDLFAYLRATQPLN